MRPFLGLSVVALVIAGLVHAAVVQEKQPAGGQDAPAMVQPTKFHGYLKAQVGTWDATVKMMMPGAPPSEDHAVATNTMIGDLWLVEDFKGSFGGMPFSGRGITGYDSHKNKYVGTWVDSMVDYLIVVEGTADATGKVRTITYEAPSQTGPGMEKHRDVTELKDNDTILLSMYTTGADGKEAMTMQITYKRRKA
ncbi:MAG: DUF1579 domain-containing protein [Planctomycetota bacterium]